MRIARENASSLLVASLAANTIINAIAEAIYFVSVRRALRAIVRFG